MVPQLPRLAAGDSASIFGALTGAFALGGALARGWVLPRAFGPQLRVVWKQLK